MDAMIVVDMQVGLRAGPPKYDLDGVIDRINKLAALLRGRGGNVIWIQHCGNGDEFARGAPGWAFLPELDHQPGDIVVEKTLNDPFAGTDLQTVLRGIAPKRVLVAGGRPTSASTRPSVRRFRTTTMSSSSVTRTH